MGRQGKIISFDTYRMRRDQEPARQLLAQWEAARRGRAIPPHHALRPEALGPLLPSCFLLRRDGGSGLPVFRLAGGVIEALAGQKLAGQPFAALFTPEHRACASLAAAPALGADVLLRIGVGAGRRCDTVVILPLLDERGSRALALGCLLGLAGDVRAPLALHSVGAQRVVSGAGPVARFVPS